MLACNIIMTLYFAHVHVEVTVYMLPVIFHWSISKRRSKIIGHSYSISISIRIIILRMITESE